MIDLSKQTPFPISCRFRAELNNGVFDYSNIPSQELVRVKPFSGIFIEKISVSANCSQLDFAEANINGINISFETRQNRTPILQRELKIFSFTDFMTLNALAITNTPAPKGNDLNAQDDYLICKISGQLEQTHALITADKQSISILISIVAYDLKLADDISALSNKRGLTADERAKLLKPEPIKYAQANSVNAADARPLVQMYNTEGALGELENGLVQTWRPTTHRGIERL